MSKGTVYWITGLAGAGKTTIGQALYQRLKKQQKNIVFLDGDLLREVFGNDLGYSREDRLKSAMRNARICNMLTQQGMDVVCCTISMFDQVREWNRKHIECYKEIYLKVPMEVLAKRNQKNLYQGCDNQVVGMSLAWEEPKQPDLVIENDGKILPKEIVDFILK